MLRLGLDLFGEKLAAVRREQGDLRRQLWRWDLVEVDLDDLHHLQQRHEARLEDEVVKGEGVPLMDEGAAGSDHRLVRLHILEDLDHHLRGGQQGRVLGD